MATFTYDGTSSITATKGDTVLITADPQTFTQATDNGSSVTLNFGSTSITVTGTTFVTGGLPNVFVSGGVFAYAGSTNTLGSTSSGNELVVLGSGTSFVQSTAAGTETTASSKLAIFGGLGRVDTVDAADTITIGGKGSFLVYGNGGGDTLTQNAVFDSTSIVNVNGDQGNDSVTFTSQNLKASIFVGGGAGTDNISIVNSGTTTIFGGLDSTDGADTITFNAVTGGAGGTSTIFGNGGADVINVGQSVGLDSTSTSTVYGGVGNDTIAATGTKATINVLGGEGSDNITVTNNGNTFITGGNQSGDQSLDSADTISFTGSGNALIYGNAGNDSITTVVGDTANVTDTSTISIYGGKDNDTITQTIGTNVTGKASIFIAGGENNDTISAQGNGGAVTIYGGISSADSTDGADVISYGSAGTSTGTANIFANAGNDTVSIGALGTDTANTVTVYGGGGNDSIVVAAQANGQQALVLNGNEGSDTFSIAKGTGQTVTVGDFSTASGGDKLVLTGLTVAAQGGAGNLQIATGNFQTLQQALDAASTASGGSATTNKAAAVVFGGSTYVVIETGTTGGGSATTFNAGSDQAIKLTGVTDLVGLVSSTTINPA